MVLLEPVERVVDHERADDLGAGPVVVDAVAPERAVARGEEGGRVAVQVVALRPEVVVDHVEEDRESAGVAGVHQGLEILRPAVAGLGSEEQHSVVAPAPAAREVGDRHQLERGDPERDQVVELRRDGRVRPLGRERAHVELVEDEALGRQPGPPAVPPGVGEGIDDLARPVHVAGLEAGGRIGHEHLPVDAVAVAGARRGLARDVLGPAARVARHRHRAPGVLEPELDPVGAGGPEAEAGAPVVARAGAERHPVGAADHRRSGHLETATWGAGGHALEERHREVGEE